MDAIDKIIEEIIIEAKKEQTEIKTQRETEIQRDFMQRKEEIEKNLAARLKKQKAEIKSNYKQKNNRQQLAARQTELQAKQGLLDQLFLGAVSQMENWSVEAIQTFSQENILQLPLKGQTAEVIAGEKTAAAFTADFITKINQEAGFNLTLASRQIPKEAGFIIDLKGVHYNFIFKNLVLELQENLSFELSQQLF